MASRNLPISGLNRTRMLPLSRRSSGMRLCGAGRYSFSRVGLTEVRGPTLNLGFGLPSRLFCEQCQSLSNSELTFSGREQTAVIPFIISP